MKTTLLLLSLLLIAVATLGIGVRRYEHNHQSGQAYTMTMTDTLYPTDGLPWVRSISTRYQKGDGNWKQVRQGFNKDGTADGGGELYGFNDLGVFGHETDSNSVTFLSQKDHAFHHVNEAAMRANRETFLGERKILGYSCLGQQSAPGIEDWLSPEFEIPLLEIHYVMNGKIVREVTQIMLGEPNFNATLPNCNVNYSPYEQKLQEQTDSKIAAQMKQIEDLTKVRIQQLQNQSSR